MIADEFDDARVAIATENSDNNNYCVSLSENLKIYVYFFTLICILHAYVLVCINVYCT